MIHTLLYSAHSEECSGTVHIAFLFGQPTFCFATIHVETLCGIVVNWSELRYAARVPVVGCDTKKNKKNKKTSVQPNTFVEQQRMTGG